MKWIFLCVVPIFALVSCGDSGETDNSMIKVSVSQLVFDATGGTQSISVTADKEWTATVSSEGTGWLTVSPSKGSSNATLKVTTNVNPQKTARTCTLQIMSGSQKANILVSQKAFVSVESVKFAEEELSLEEGESKQVAVTIYPENASKRLLKWSVADTSIATVDSIGKVSARAAGSTTLSAISQDGSKETAICKIKVFEFHEYVDLGLPSHTLWANRNMGAKEPWDTGDFFAWGILRSYEGGQIFNKENYKYYNVADDVYTKYVTEKGVPDGLIELEPADDAATYYWGPKWTMPTAKQFQELIDNCDWSRVQDFKTGQYGWMVQSRKNNHNIFFPFTNEYYAPMGTTQNMRNEYYDNNRGWYWTKDLYLDYNYLPDSWAVCLDIQIHSYSISNTSRTAGIAIRPVRTISY